MTPDPYRYFRVEARELLDELGRGALALEQGVPSAELVQKLLRVAHTLKGAARVVKQNEIAGLAHAAEDLLSPLREKPAALSLENADEFLGIVDSIRSLVGALEEPVATEAGQVPATQTAPNMVAEEIARTVRVDVAEMDALLGQLTEAAIEITSLGEAGALVERCRNLADLLSERIALPRLAVSNGVPVPHSAPQALHWAEELSGVTGTASRKLGDGIERIRHRIQEARHRAEQLRLVPVRTLLPTLERVARDAAQSTGKRAGIEMRDSDVRLDSDVLATVQAALVQLVRNAVAHGIEPEAGRDKAGKPPVGKITLAVHQDGRRVAFECNDDGDGIDLETVRRKVRVRGASPQSVDNLGQRELLDLLLQGGVSTTDSVTEVAGRGVGLDLVRDVAARLKGSVRIDTRPGQGTSVELKVPITLAALEALVFEAGDLVIAVPLHAVRASARVNFSELVHSGNSLHLTHENAAVPFAHLSAFLRGNRDRAPSEVCSTIVFETSGGKAALGVDRLLGTETVVFRPMPALAPAGDLWMGTFLNAGGEPCVVLDPDRAFALASKGTVAQDDAEDKTCLPILVIDDSLTTRMLEQSILESAGYEVDLAVSGEDGLEKARKRDYALFLVDVEMPGMDGFTFVATTRADPVLRRVPAIIVSSRASADDLRRGKEAGASDYVIKSEFEQKALLKRIEELVG